MDQLALLREELATMLAETPLPPAVPADEEFPGVDLSPRARKTREILRIARVNEWEDAITVFLENRNVAYLSDLSVPQLDDLLSRMHGFVDAAEMGCSLPDCLPAT